ncbi:hypothetical protein R4Z10_19880 [Niallia sp. XMNu-256]|uniref:hypothetical protein n=1 Tax=Niallia sp. XMNu-256 TaxID=3082444 RepID=UPI0030D5F46E
MSTIPKNEIERMELLLESLIRMQGSLNAKTDFLNHRLNLVEQALQQLPQQDNQHLVLK